jgi:dihydrodipicolinate reductase
LQKVNILLNGLGKMNCANVARIQSDKSLSTNIKFIAAVDPQPNYSNPMIENTINSLKTTGMILEESMDSLDLKDIFPKEIPKYIIDFSSEDGCVEGVTKALEFGLNVISGSTPISKKSDDLVKRKILEAKVKGIRCDNFSLHVTKFLYNLNNVVQTIDAEDDIAIIESHRMEKPTTSGTAQLMARTLCQSTSKVGYILLNEKKAFDSSGVEIAIPSREKMKSYIKISAVRFADEPGIHNIIVGDENNYRKYCVRATRHSLSEGVCRSLKFLINANEPGLYTFKEDVLNLR